jgi:hypothetical protein
MNSEPGSLRFKAYGVLAVSAFVLLLVFRFLEAVIPELIFALPQNAFSTTLSFLVWYVFIVKYMPRCPNCGFGVLSLFELGSLPLVLIPWFARKCFRCHLTR